MRPGFPKFGAFELIFASERGVLRTDIFKFEGLRTKIWAKIEAVAGGGGTQFLFIYLFIYLFVFLFTYFFVGRPMCRTGFQK